MQPDDEIDPSKLKKPAGRKADHSPQDILKLLPAEGLTDGDWKKTAESQRGMCAKTFYNLKNKLATDGLILKDSNKWKRNTTKEV